jgi:hypothetical protein
MKYRLENFAVNLHQVLPPRLREDRPGRCRTAGVTFASVREGQRQNAKLVFWAAPPSAFQAATSPKGEGLG